MTATGYLMLDSLSYEAASVPLKLVYFLKKSRRQCDGDSLGR